jgi:hypothetical protein
LPAWRYTSCTVPLSLRRITVQNACTVLRDSGLAFSLCCISARFPLLSIFSQSYFRYEKKRGKDSFWYSYIKELDHQRARGPLAAESPLIWKDEEVETYLRGSPVQELVRARLESIKEEYDALDTVWFMSGSLFNKYPYVPFLPRHTVANSQVCQGFEAIINFTASSAVVGVVVFTCVWLQDA